MRDRVAVECVRIGLDAIYNVNKTKTYIRGGGGVSLGRTIEICKAQWPRKRKVTKA